MTRLIAAALFVVIGTAEAQTVAPVPTYVITPESFAPMMWVQCGQDIPSKPCDKIMSILNLRSADAAGRNKKP